MERKARDIATLNRKMEALAAAHGTELPGGECSGAKSVTWSS